MTPCSLVSLLPLMCTCSRDMAQRAPPTARPRWTTGGAARAVSHRHSLAASGHCSSVPCSPRTRTHHALPPYALFRVPVAGICLRVATPAIIVGRCSGFSQRRRSLIRGRAGAARSVQRSRAMGRRLDLLAGMEESVLSHSSRSPLTRPHFTALHLSALGLSRCAAQRGAALRPRRRRRRTHSHR